MPQDCRDRFGSAERAVLGTAGADGVPHLVVDPAPLVDLDPGHYATMALFEARFPAGPPSLAGAESLTVRGDWTFGADVVAQGAAELADEGSAREVPDGAVIGTATA